MGTIKQLGCKDKPFINIKTMYENCRCCGKGRNWVCDSCNTLINNGHAFFIEVRDLLGAQYKKPTGYVIAFKASVAYENGHPEVMLTPGIYFIEESNLKQFLGNGYNKINYGNPTKVLRNGAKFLSPDSGTTGSPRSATELAY